MQRAIQDIIANVRRNVTALEFAAMIPHEPEDVARTVGIIVAEVERVQALIEGTDGK